MKLKFLFKTQISQQRKLFSPILVILLASAPAFAAEQSVSALLETTKKITDLNKLSNEDLENQIDTFLHVKIKTNSLVLLKENPIMMTEGEVRNPKVKTSTNEIVRVKIPTDSVVTGISCNGVLEFFKNEGIQAFQDNQEKLKTKQDTVKINIMQDTLVKYFEDEQIKKHFSKRTLQILKDDLIKQVKNALRLRRLPRVCFADLKEPSNEKHTVYLNQEIIDNQTSDYRSEYELIDFTYDDNYISNIGAPTNSTEKE